MNNLETVSSDTSLLIKGIIFFFKNIFNNTIQDGIDGNKKSKNYYCIQILWKYDELKKFNNRISQKIFKYKNWFEFNLFNVFFQKGSNGFWFNPSN